MLIEFLSIVIFTFALTLLGLGAVTWWIERAHRRWLGLLLIGVALLIGGGYALLASRFAIAWFGRLIITLNLPRLMATAITYTIGVLGGFILAGSIFVWISGRLVQPTRLERKIAVFVGLVLLVALALSGLAVKISQ